VSLRSEYQARWYNPLTAAVVLTFDLIHENGCTLKQATRAAGTVFAVPREEVEIVVNATMADAMQRLGVADEILGREQAEQQPPPSPADSESG